MSVLVHEVRNPSAIAGIHELAATLIVDYKAEQVDRADAERARALHDLFDGAAPSGSVVLAALDEAEVLVGAAVLERPVLDELIAEHRDRARDYSKAHFLLSALFVIPDSRKRGIGEQLLDVAAAKAFELGARWLDGFADARTGSVDFYRAAGAAVMPLNDPLPDRQPARVPMGVPLGLHGHWFYIDNLPRFGDLITCPRHRTPLEFDPSNGGYMRCPACSTSRLS